MNKMYIVEWSNDYHEAVKIKICEEQKDVTNFVGVFSSEKYFKIHHINLYEKGKLRPYKLELINGKLTLMEMEGSK